MSDTNYELDDEFEYHAYRVGRPTRTVEVKAGDGTQTIEEGTLTAELVHKDDLRLMDDDGWMVHYVGPDGGVGFKGGVPVPYDLVDIIPLPEPMTEKEADEWFEDEQLLELADELIESDLTAEEFLEAVR